MEYTKFGSGKKAFVMLPGLSVKSVLLSANAVYDEAPDFKDRIKYFFDKY